MTWSLLFLAACSRDPGENAALTDTFPAFYGEAPTNLLVVSLDTFRPDHMARYGDDRGLMPFFDSIAAQGVALDAHLSCSNWTYPGSQCAMDGYSALDLGLLPDPARTPLPDRVTLSSALRDAGYHTILSTSNSWQHEDTNASYGFQDVFLKKRDSATAIYNAGRNKLLNKLDADSAPWMLHLHLYEPHTPYAPPASYLSDLDDLDPIDIDFEDEDAHRSSCSDWSSLGADEQALVLAHTTTRYSGELRYLDNQLISMWDDLDERGLLDDTLVVFWSDHGEQFFERGLCTHARDLFREENDAVGIFWSKNMASGAVTIPTTHADLAPTALQILGVAVPPEMTGTPIDQLDPDRAVHSYVDANRGVVQSVVQGSLKLVYYWNDGAHKRYQPPGQKHLLDLATDPGEQTNLYDSTDPRVIDLWEQLMPEVERMQAIREGITPVNAGP